jgi:hypothetical protein
MTEESTSSKRARRGSALTNCKPKERSIALKELSVNEEDVYK